MITTANLATLEIRIPTATDTIYSLIDQVDIMRVYIDFEPPREWLHIKKLEIIEVSNDPWRSSRKVWKALEPDQYYLNVDDDLIYNKNYVDDHIKTLNKFNDEIVLSLHGRVLKDNFGSYYGSVKKSYRVLDDSPNGFVNIIGNGCSIWNTNKFKVDLKKWKYYYMDDICVSIDAEKQGISRYVREHKKGYVLYNEPNGTTLHTQYNGNDQTQTEMVKKINWKKI